MSIRDYPIYESAAFLVTKDVASAINMTSDDDTRSISELSPVEREELSDISLAGEVIEDIEGAARFYNFDGIAISLCDCNVVKTDSPSGN